VVGGGQTLKAALVFYIYMRIHMPYLSISRFDFAFSPKSLCILHRKRTTSSKTKKLKVIPINNNRTKVCIFIHVEKTE